MTSARATPPSYGETNLAINEVAPWRTLATWDSPKPSLLLGKED